MTSVVALTELLSIGGSPITTDNPLPVSPINVQTEFRESFETYNTSTVWSQSVASGDIVQLDGNAGGCSYLVISKDPTSAGGETIIETQAAFTGPFETAVGLSMSQRVLGQECAIELVSTDTPIPPIADIAIAGISQTTTTLSVTTVAPHGLTVGQRIGIYGVSDSRLNYPSLVIASTFSPTTFNCTAGPGGAIPSLTTGGVTNQGYVYNRPALGYAQEGMSQIFENGTATNASMYIRADSGDALPTGTLNSIHSLTVATTASVSLVNTSYTYAFNPTAEYKFLLQADRASFYDYAVDSTGQPSTRQNRSSVIPNITKTYKLRFRVTNDKALTIPTAKIVSAVKPGTNVVTITTAAAHGLTTSDYILVYGIRDQTNFVNQTAQLPVSSVINSTQFTVAFGSAATATSYGGMVLRSQGGNNPGVYSNGGTAIQTATVTTSVVPTGELWVTGTGTWTLSIGDYVQVYGCRDSTTGADVGVDGAYKVTDITTVTLRMIPIGSTVLPAPFTSVNCGGSVIKRTDVRISYTRIMQYLRERVELINKGDAYSAIPVVPNTSFPVTVSSSLQAINAGVADIGSTALTTTTTTTAITPTAGALSHEFNIIVTAVTGTNPTLDVVVQESDDVGTNWYDVYHFPRITAIGQYRSPLIPLTGNRIRYVQTVTGTTPSFTRSINRLQSQTFLPLQRQFIDRTIAPNTLNSVTPTFFTEGTRAINIVVSMGATTISPTLAYEGSADGAAWYSVTPDTTPAANTNVTINVDNVLARFFRVRVSSAGTGATLNYVMVKGMG